MRDWACAKRSGLERSLQFTAVFGRSLSPLRFGGYFCPR